jgi:uronate dehydrogenase
MGNLYENEVFIKADIGKLEDIESLTKTVSMIIHFGAIVDELPFETLLAPNFIGSYNIWESARRNNVKRVIYASSIHAVGMYSKTKTINPSTHHRPDGFYGLSKCFTEDLAKMYFDKNGIEAVCLRIATCAPVTTERSLTSWLSYNDLVLLVTRAITSTFTEFSVIYGVSNNDRKNIDNSEASHIGFKPIDNAEKYVNKIYESDLSEELSDPGNKFHGGPFASTDLGVSPMSKMKIIHKLKGEEINEG